MHLVVGRIAELEEVLSQPGFDLATAERRVSELTGTSSRRALETAVLHRNNVAHRRDEGPARARARGAR